MPSASARSLVLGLPVDRLSVEALHGRLRAFVGAGARATVLHVNAHAMNLAAREPWLAASFREADLVLCDGSGIQLAARLLGEPVPERITYADWTWRLATWCAAEGLSIFLLGAEPGVAEAAARRLQEHAPALRIAGTHHGFFDHHANGEASADVVRLVNAARPDLLLVGFGMPAQERWVREWRAHLQVPVVLTAGAALDYVSGRLRRAPRWMTTHGLEWLGRLLIEPRRLMGRYLAGNPLFLLRVIGARLSMPRRPGRRTP